MNGWLECEWGILWIGFGEAVQSDGEREDCAEESWKAASAGEEEHQKEVAVVEVGGFSFVAILAVVVAIADFVAAAVVNLISCC